MGYLTEGLPEELQEFPIDVFFSYSHAAFSGESNPELKRWAQSSPRICARNSGFWPGPPESLPR